MITVIKTVQSNISLTVALLYCNTKQMHVSNSSNVTMEKDSRGQYEVHVSPKTEYQCCHELQYDSFGSVKGTMTEY